MGDRIMQLRVQKGLSQTGLSRLSGVSRTLIYLLESGRRQETTLRTLKKLASALDVEPGCLLE